MRFYGLHFGIPHVWARPDELAVADIAKEFLRGDLNPHFWDYPTLFRSYDRETFETNVPGLYVAGGALAGIDTGTIFIENGRFHGEKIIEAIASRL